MKRLCSMVALIIVLISCQSGSDNSDAAFQKNSATVKAYLQGFQAENVDYSVFSDDFILRDTGFGAKDTVTLAQMKEGDKRLFAAYNFKIVNFDAMVFLPGVNAQTKKPDGSVRFYADYEVTRPATDSTEAKTGILKGYESYDFDANGKIIFQQGYGDFSGLMTYLNK